MKTQKFMLKTRYFPPTLVTPKWGVYDNGEPALVLVDDNGEAVFKASVCMSRPLDEGLIHIKTWSENEGLLPALERAGLVKDTGVRVESGFANAALCRILPAAP